MTSTEVSIRFFERHLKEDILKYGERQAIHMAIAALTEQEERSNGCDFCKGAKYIYGELSASGHVDDDHDFVHEQYGDLPICPMCGRRLEEV